MKRKSAGKRRLHRGIDPARAKGLAEQVSYGGHPHHKRSPGDFGLTPPASPRPNKSLCDGVGIFQLETARQLLREGIARGVMSPDGDCGFPRYVWTVTEAGAVLEMRCDDPQRGRYHGYPLEPDDPMAELVCRRWRQQK